MINTDLIHLFSLGPIENLAQHFRSEKESEKSLTVSSMKRHLQVNEGKKNGSLLEPSILYSVVTTAGEDSPGWPCVLVF